MTEQDWKFAAGLMFLFGVVVGLSIALVLANLPRRR